MRRPRRTSELWLAIWRSTVCVPLGKTCLSQPGSATCRARNVEGSVPVAGERSRRTNSPGSPLFSEECLIAVTERRERGRVAGSPGPPPPGSDEQAHCRRESRQHEVGKDSRG